MLKKLWFCFLNELDYVAQDKWEQSNYFKVVNINGLDYVVPRSCKEQRS